MLATRAQALELSIVFSQSLARRRHRPSQASVRSSGRVGSLDDLDGPVPLPLEGIAQFAARIASIGEDVAQPWKPVADGLEQRQGSVAILHILMRSPGRFGISEGAMTAQSCPRAEICRCSP